MKKIMKKVSVLVTLCMIMTTLSAQPIFAAGTYTVDNGGYDYRSLCTTSGCM